MTICDGKCCEQASHGPARGEEMRMSLGEHGTIRVWRTTAHAAALGLLLWLLAGGTSLGDGVTPTTEWINLYSLDSTLDEDPLPVGASIAVLDPEGTKCGEGTVTREGWYGLLPCYRDDPTTPVDEGAVAGDVLRFVIEGEQAAATVVSLNGNGLPRSTEVTWTAQGDRWEVDLNGATLPPIVGGYSMPPDWPFSSWPWPRIVPLLGLVAVAGGITAAARRMRRLD
jgi:hypothetical protein